MAIQGLNQKLEEAVKSKDAEIEALKSQVSALAAHNITVMAALNDRVALIERGIAGVALVRGAGLRSRSFHTKVAAD